METDPEHKELDGAGVAVERAGWEAVAQIARDRGDTSTAEEADANAARLSATTPPESEPVGDLARALTKIAALATELRCTDSSRHEALHHCGKIATAALTAQRGLNLAKEGVGEAMRRACIEAVNAEKRYESSDFPVCNSIINVIQAIDVTALAGGKTEGGA